MRVWMALLAVVLLASPLRAEPEPETEAGAFPAALRDYLRDVVEDVTHLEKREASPKSRLWLTSLHRQLQVAAELVKTRPKPLVLPESLHAAHDAWARARHDTHKVYSDLSKAAKTTELRADLRARSRGLAIGYRSACREALTVFTSKEALAAYPAVGPKLPGRSKLEAPFNTGQAHAVCKLAATFTRALHKHESREDAQRLTRMDTQSILVVEGQFDRIALTLQALRVPFRKTTPYDLKPDSFKRHRTVLWGCSERLPRERERRVLRGLRSFVERGGYLYTTDWSVDSVLRIVAPGYLRTPGTRSGTNEIVVEIQAHPNATAHALLRGVFRTGVTTRVWLEEAWFPLARGVTGPKMRVLWVAPILESTYSRNPKVAVTFPLRRGRVLHVIPMAYQRGGTLAGVMATQRLLLNFICQALPKE
ncbi:MAG: hypothetical protein GY946_29750 [bacterium]|nr:hypothetical protein [bacterium]